MNTKNARRPARRSLVALVSVSLVFGPLVESAYAGPTPLADVPIAAKVAAKPNIVYTLDDSGSMQSTICPTGSSRRLRRYTAAAETTRPPALRQQPDRFQQLRCARESRFTSPPFYAADFNHLVYDPNVNYTPPVKADGTPLTHTIGIDTDVNGNQINLAKVQSDPFTSPATQANLTPR